MNSVNEAEEAEGGCSITSSILHAVAGMTWDADIIILGFGLAAESVADSVSEAF